MMLGIMGCLAIVTLMGVAFVGYFVFARMETSRAAEMEALRRQMKEDAARAADAAAEAELEAFEQAEALSAQAAAEAEAKALAAKEAADARRGAPPPPPPDLGEELIDGMVPAEKIKRLQEQLALLQQRFDRRVQEDEAMLKSMRDQLEMTRRELEKAHAKIRELEAEKQKK